MKKTLIPFLVLAVALFIITPLKSQNGEDAKFQKTFDDYMDAYWKFFPSAATVAGYHKYDNKLEDMSKKDIEKRHEELDEFNQNFVAKVDKMALSPEFQIDHELIVDGLDMELMNHEMLVPWDYNPLFYNNIFKYCIRGLIENPSGSADDVAKNVEKRLSGLPKLIKQAKENLQTPPQIYTETAIKQFETILDWYRNELPQWVGSSAGSQQNKIQSALGKAMPELEGYLAFLQNELLGRSTGSFRLAEAHARLVRLTFHNTIPLTELIERAKVDINNTRREMFLCCLGLYKIMDPRFDIENPPASLTEEQVKSEVISHVLDHIKSEHVSKEEFFNKVQQTAGEIKAFINEKQLVDLPDKDLAFAEMPQDQRGFRWYNLVAPLPTADNGDYAWQLAPFNDTLTEEQIQSLLEEYNNFLLPFWVTRNVYPGQFVPLYTTRQNASTIRKMYPDNPLIKGWPIFIEEALVMKGFRNYDIRVRLNQLKLKLRVATDFLTEFQIHEGPWTKEDAVAYMTRTGFQSEAEAVRKWDQISLNPGYSLYGYVGYQEMLDIHNKYKQNKGDSYSFKEFMSELLSYGPIPTRHLKMKMVGM
jgi:uncharacterized protein (DUF885 family)